MKKMSVCGMTTVLLAIGFANGLHADVILDEPNLGGTVGLTGETFGSGKVTASWSDGSVSNPLTSRDSNYALRVDIDKTINLAASMDSFASSGARLTHYYNGIPALALDEKWRVLDLKRDSGRIRGSVNVTGNSGSEGVTYIIMSASAQPSSTESYLGSVQTTQAPFTALQPMPALSNTKVSGSVALKKEKVGGGECSITVSLPEKYVDVPVGGTIDVTWPIDMTQLTCPSLPPPKTGILQGNVILSGLAGQNSDAFSSLVIQARSSSCNLGISGGSYLFPDIAVGPFPVLSKIYLKSPYSGIITFYNEKIAFVSEGKTATYDLSYSVGTLHGAIKPKGLWDMSNVYRMRAHFKGGNVTSYDYADLITGQFDIVAPTGQEYLYQITPGFLTKNKSRVTEQYYYRDYDSMTSPFKATITDGCRLENLDLTIESSAINQGIYLADKDVGIKRLVITGKDYNPETGELIEKNKIELMSNLTASGIPTNGVIVPIYGEPGSYKMTAVADGDDGGTYRKEFILELMSPQCTEAGHADPLSFATVTGKPIGTVTFDSTCASSSTTAGCTAINVSNIGPRPPANFKVYSSGNNLDTFDEYYDIRSTVNSCKATVCFYYDETKISGQELGLKLGRYTCQSDGNPPCDWQQIPATVYPDENKICAETSTYSGYSAFAILEPLDQDGDGFLENSDNCPSVANPDQLNNDGDAQGDVCDTDDDNDAVLDSSDNCPLLANADQADNDGDRIGDACDDDDDNDTMLDAADNCKFTANAGQSDIDGDGQGDACDGDRDGDGIANEADNCPAAANTDQADNDGDGQGDACDDDDDNDAVLDATDNCPLTENADQNDLDGDHIGDVCDIDLDGDGVNNVDDNCELTSNADQEDTDGDHIGDACDEDDDNDGVLDAADNCSLMHNPGQENMDGDAQGDVCDGDLDGDSIANSTDNCPNVPNASQSDFDSDSKGDACDDDVDADGVLNGNDVCTLTELNAVVKSAEGCSIAQLCPCAGPRGTTGTWKNHGGYVSCTAKSAESFVGLNLITEAEKDAIVAAAAQSTCGK